MLHEATAKSSRTLHNAVTCAYILWMLWHHLGCFAEPSIQPQLPTEHFHSESTIPSAKPWGLEQIM